MFDHFTHPPQLPHAAGVGYKADHFDQITAAPGPVKWLEIHAENYLGAGGRPKAQLIALRDRFALSVHGVGLSIGGGSPAGSDPFGAGQGPV